MNGTAKKYLVLIKGQKFDLKKRITIKSLAAVISLDSGLTGRAHNI